MITKDKSGVKLKYPNRTCKKCKLYPCFDGIESCRCDFSSYGCKLYVGIPNKDPTLNGSIS